MHTATPARSRVHSPPAPVLLRSAEDLRAYLRGWRALTPHGPFQLDLPGLESAGLQRRLDFWRTVCGCLPAGLTVLTALVWRGIVTAQSGARSAGSVVIELGFVLLLGIAAKLVAIAGARLILQLKIGRLWRRFRPDRQGPKESLR